MQGQVSLLAIAGLPLAAGLMITAMEASWRRWFGDERALVLAGRIGLGATLLAAMLLALAMYALALATDSGAELAATQAVAWAGAGWTTKLALDLELGGLARVVCVVALATGLALQIAALGDPRAGIRGLGRTALLLGGVLLLALASTVWGAALGWQIAVLATWRGGQVAEDRSGGTWRGGHGAEDRAEGTGASEQVSAWRWSDGGVWLAVLAIAVGAGDLGIELVTRAVLLGEHSTFLHGGPIAGLAPVTVATLGLCVAVLGRVVVLAPLREAAAGRAAVLGLGAGAGVLLLLRLHVVLVLAPVVMAALVVVGGVAALGYAVAGLRARRAEEAVLRVVQAQLGLCLVALGMGGWMAACGLLLASGLASAAATLAWSAGGRAGGSLRWLAALALAGLLPGGVALWAGELGGVGLTYMSAWSPWLNWAAAGLVGCSLLAIAGSLGHVLRDRSTATGGPELALGAGLLAALAAVLGVIDMPGSAAALRVWLAPEFTPSWLLRGEFALGPLPPYRVEQARWGVLAAVGLAGAGLLLAPRLRALALRIATPAWSPGAWLARRARALIAGLHELGERRVLALLLVAGSPGVARAPGRGDLQGALVLALFGALGVLAVVFANPDVVRVGPTRVYPVDLGGLDPALIGSRRGQGKPGRAELAPGTGAGGVGELVPGTGAGELAPGTGAGELAPGTGAGELAPGTGAGELAPGTGVRREVGR
ncbi:hypothetical protein [Nannocystis sp.]|uniref:hypothetical protein n=1 Tax=Nannocystis sp. TaxID=1962667 RepID=UPI0025D8335D|nr:hypothetical protein [Nannocystis sp.]MBK7830528.1 hypothetical protein [Nannocystis sp.]